MKGNDIIHRAFAFHRAKDRRRLVSFWSVAVALVLALLWSSTLSSHAQTRTFVVSGEPVTFSDESARFQVHFAAMRFNRASNAWNVEVSVRNTGSSAASGRLLLVVAQSTGIAGLPDTDNATGAPPNELPFWELTGHFEGPSFAAGATTRPRTIALGRMGNQTPRLTPAVYVASTHTTPRSLAHVQTLNGDGHPLPGVRIEETRGDSTRTLRSDPGAGSATLGGVPGAHRWRFIHEGFLPAWRDRALETRVVRLPSPRLTARGNSRVPIGPKGGTLAIGDVLQVEAPDNSAIVPGFVTVTVLESQSLPYGLPRGWNPQRAWWLESEQPFAVPLTVFARPREPLPVGQEVFLARFDANALQWIVLERHIGRGSDWLWTSADRPGAYAIVVGDSGLSAPPSPSVGRALAGTSAAEPPSGFIAVSGQVVPAVSLASTNPVEVTARAQLRISTTHQVLPSGTALRVVVHEVYQLSTGQRLAPPPYETSITAYRNPLGTNASLAEVEFPMRPQLLLDGARLVEGVVTARVLSADSEPSGILGGTNATLRLEGLVLSLDGASPDGWQVIELNPHRSSAGSLAAAEQSPLAALLTKGAGSGPVDLDRGEVIVSFDLTLGDLGPESSLDVRLEPPPPEGDYVLCRAWYRGMEAGLEPVARIAVRNGSWTNLDREPDRSTAVRLGGVDRSGQYALVRVDRPQGIVAGQVVDEAGFPVAGTLVELTPWSVLTGSDGWFRTLAGAGNGVLRTRDPVTGDRLQHAIAMPASLVHEPLAITSAGGPPFVLAVTPPDGATDVSLLAMIRVEFSKPVLPRTRDSGLELLDAAGLRVPARIDWAPDGASARLTPSNQLFELTPYTLRVSTNITDAAGRRIAAGTTTAFTTLTNILTRRLGAQLYSEAPDAQGNSRVIGTAGMAPPRSPVLFVNDTTGQTATLLSNADGSFTNALSAAVEDRLRVVFVNGDGSRMELPVGRQVFPDGSVALYSEGGRITNRNDSLSVVLDVPPGAVLGRTRFKLQAHELSAVPMLTSNTPPDQGQVFGAFQLEVTGDAVRGKLRIEVEAPASALTPPPGGTLADLALVAAAFDSVEEEVEGVRQRVMGYRYQGPLLPLETAQAGSRLASVRRPNLLDIGLYALIDPSSARVMLFGTPYYSKTEVLGQTLSALFVGGRDVVQGSEVPVGGAVVRARARSQLNPRPFTLQPGELYATSEQDGRFAFLVPNQGPAGGHSLIATHPNFPRQFGTGAANRFDPDHPFAGGRVFFDRNRPPDDVAPSVSVAHAPPYPVASGDMEVRVEAVDDSGPATVVLELDRVEPNTAVVTIVQRRAGLWDVRCNAAAKVILRARATDAGGNVREQSHVILVGANPPPPAPPNDPLGPRVVYSEPDADAVGVNPLARVTLYLSEWVSPDTVLNPDAFFTLAPAGGPVAATFGRDQREIHLRYPALRNGVEYTLTAQGLRDLTGQWLDQDPSTPSPTNEPFQLRFRTAPEVRGTLPGVAEGGGVVLRGAYAYLIDRQSQTLNRYDVSIPGEPVLSGQKFLPGPPRSLALIQDYEFTLEFETPGVPGPRPGPLHRADLLVVAGKTSGTDLGYLRVFDLSQPFQTLAHIAGGVVSLDTAALLTRLVWSAPFLLLVENSLAAPQVHVLNLQGVLLGDAYRRVDPMDLLELPLESTPGLDANGDGDFVDPGDALPLVGRETVNILVGEQETWSLAPNRSGPSGFYQLVESSRYITDAAIDGLSGQAVVVTTPGQDQLLEVALLPVRTNRLSRPATLRSYIVGQLTPDTLVPPVIPEAYALEYPGWYPKRALMLTVGLERLVLLNLISLDNSSNSLRIISASRPDGLFDVGEIPLPVSEYGLLQGAELDDLGRVVLSTASVTGEDLVLLDPQRLLQPAPNSGPHPAILGRISGAGAGVTPYDLGAHGVSAASLRQRNVVSQTAPGIRFLPPGQATLDALAELEVDVRIAALRALPDPVELPVARQGTNAAFAVDHPDFSWHLLLDAPGGAGREVRLAVMSVDAAGGLVQGTNSQLHSFEAGVALHRLSDDPVSPGFNLYVSGPIVLVDDSIDPNELQRIRAGRHPLRAGVRVRVGIPESMSGNPVLGPFAGTGILQSSPPPNAPPLRLGASLGRPVHVSQPELTAESPVVLRTTVDRIQGRACPGSGWLEYAHNLDADISILIDGQPLRNVYDDSGRSIAEFMGVPSVAGSHRVLLDAAQVPAPGEHRFEIVATRFAGLPPERSLRVEGMVDHEIEIHHNFPVGHTVVQGVDLWDGHLAHSSRDVLIPGRKLSLEFNRSYSSSGSSSDGPLGAGWTHSYNVRLVHRLNCGVFTVIGGEGSGNSFTDPRPDATRAARYLPLLPADVVAADLEFFTPQIGYHSTLVRDLRRAGEFWFFTKEGVRHHFIAEGSLATSSESVFTLREIREPNGNALRFEYHDGDADPATLDTVTEIDPFGALPKRGFRFEYSRIGGQPRITTLRGFNHQGTRDLLGLEIRYGYDTWGNLTNVLRVGSGPDDTRNESYAYTATDGPFGHNLLEYRDPNGAIARYRYAAAPAASSGSTSNYYAVGDVLLPGVPLHEVVTNVTYVGGARPGFEATRDASYGFRYDFANSWRYVSDPRAAEGDGDGAPIPDTAYTLNAYGATTRIEAPLGQVTEMRWATDHLDGSVLNSNGQPVHDVLLTWRRDPEGQEQAFHYEDGRGNLTLERTSFATSTKRPVTDRQGNVVAAIERRTAYDALFNQRTNVVDAEGNATVFILDPRNGNLLRTIDAEGYETRHVHFPNGDLERRIDPRGNATEFAEYDLYGNARRVRDAVGNETITEHDERSRLIESRDTFGHHTLHHYDSLDRGISEQRLNDLADAAVLNGLPTGPAAVSGTRYLPGGQVVATTNSLGLVTRHFHDALNREVRAEQVNVIQVAGPPQTYTTRVVYDAAGNMVEEVDARGVTRRHAYDALHRRLRTTVTGPFGGPFNADGIVSRLAYDRAGNLTNEVDMHGLATRHVHDALYRVVETHPPFPGAVLSTRYDREGNRVFSTDANGNGTTLEYDRIHRVIRTVDPEGNITTLGYDEANNRTNVHDHSSQRITSITFDRVQREISRTVQGPGLPAQGYTTTTTYNDARNEVIVTNPRGFRLRTRRDGLDRVAEVVVDADNLDLTTRYTYDAAGNVLTVSDPRGSDVDASYVYDSLGRRLRGTFIGTAEAPAPVTDTVTYDGAGLVVQTTDRRGFEARASFDNLGRPLRAELREALSNGGAWLTLSRSEYDDAAHSVTTWDARGNASVVVMDGLGRPTRMVDPLGQEVVLTHDAINLREETDRRGQRREHTYDRLNRLLRTVEFDSAGVSQTTHETAYLDAQRLVRTTDRRGLVTVAESDALGRVVRMERSGGDLATRYGLDPLPLELREYDGNNNVVRVTDANGRIAVREYDGADRLTNVIAALGTSVEASTALRLDEVGNVVEVKDGRAHGGTFDVRHEYDARHRRVATSNALGQTTRFRYDPADNLVEILEPLGHVTRYEYDELNMLVTVDESARATLGDAGFTRIRYDANRNRIAQQDPNGNLVTFVYDAINRLTHTFQHTLPGSLGAGADRNAALGGGIPFAWNTQYDPNNNPSTILDPRGQRVDLAYDHLNRLVRRSYTNHAELQPDTGAPLDFQPLAIEYAYDGNGNPVAATEVKQLGAGAITERTLRTYDALDRLVEARRFDHDDATGRRLQFAYDPVGNRTNIVDPDQRVTAYEFDERNRLRAVTWTSTSGAAPQSSVYQWEADSLLRRIELPGGTSANFAYDPADRIVGIAQTNNALAATYSLFSYEYDANGNRVRQVEVLPGLATPTETTTYLYDRLNRLRVVRYGAAGAITNTYAPNGNRLREQGVDPVSRQPIDRAYIYEAIPGPAATTFSGVNALTRIEDRITPANSIRFEYDANLNQVARIRGTDRREFRYDIRDQLLAADVGSQGVQFDYNADRLRTKKISAQGETRYLYDQSSVLIEYGDAGTAHATQHKYDYGDRLLALGTPLPGGALDRALFLTDALGSTANLVDEAGAPIVTYRYDAWGRVRERDGTSDNPRLYTGHYHDAETGLHYFGARYYDEEQGRFLSQDPYPGRVQSPPSLHRYLYAHANPLGFTDPTGFASQAADPADKFIEEARSQLARLDQQMREDVRNDPDPNYGGAAGLAKLDAGPKAELQLQRMDEERRRMLKETGLTEADLRNPVMADRAKWGIALLQRDLGNWVAEGDGGILRPLVATAVDTAATLALGGLELGAAAGTVAGKVDVGAEVTAGEWIAAGSDVLSVAGGAGTLGKIGLSAIGRRAARQAAANAARGAVIVEARRSIGREVAQAVKLIDDAPRRIAADRASHLASQEANLAGRALAAEGRAAAGTARPGVIDPARVDSLVRSFGGKLSSGQRAFVDDLASRHRSSDIRMMAQGPDEITQRFNPAIERAKQSRIDKNNQLTGRWVFEATGDEVFRHGIGIFRGAHERPILAASILRSQQVRLAIPGKPGSLAVYGPGVYAYGPGPLNIPHVRFQVPPGTAIEAIYTRTSGNFFRIVTASGEELPIRNAVLEGFGPDELDFINALR